uniref:NBS-LRR disease resistance protein NBS54 n=1 Tax=Dimocarpus longan TaxID=128017 RepID=A0A0F6RAM3_9ROSI|nr:NBS-LRR disease resistance protein NBS54 [Dimocarpus longan]AKE49470.1 NBS-LRR disease resistance protein NBS55 [Dimocarpus longan]
MAADNIGGAFLGAVFGELLKVVTEAIRKALKFKAELEKLKSTIESITPTIQEIEKLNRGLDLPEREIAKLKQEMIQGINLVRKCSKVRFYCFKKVKYTDKLIKLNQSIEFFCNVNVQLQTARDNKKILTEVNSIGRLLSGNENGSRVFAGTRIDKPCSAPEAPESTPGLDAPLKELRMELLKDDRVQVIVVSAPPGAGKTTLAKKICADSKVKEKFEDIFFVTVSSTPDVKVIVQRILEHKQCNVPMFLTDEVAVSDLERLLKEEAAKAPKATLLVLDDVWSESLVYKFKFKLPNYKILVTSRYVFSKFGSTFRLNPLNEEAAMTLFRSSVMPQDGEPSFFDENLAKKIIKICKGSPLVLTVVGRSLCREPAVVWQSRVKEWDQGISVISSDTELLSCLQSSLNALDDKVKECYLDLGSFPEDQRIPVPALIDMWMEMHEWVEEGLSAINYLHELSKRNLVNLFIARKNASDDGCYNDHFVTQHDLLRELVIHRSMSEPIEQGKRLMIEIRENSFPKWWSQQKSNPTQARLLSISTDEKFSLCWYDMNAPEVEVVVLNLRTNKYTLPNFLENMGKLMVLIVTNNGFLPSELSNFSILGSDTLSNLRRIRLEHISIPSFNVQIANLQKISLVMCNVGQAFKNSTLKISDAFPNLLEFEIDYCNDLEELPDGVCDIVPLKKLSITNCHKLSQLPEEIGKLLKLEELRLASCTDLSALPDKITRLPNLKILDISDCLGIKELPTQIGELRTLETICMKGCYICELPDSVMDLKSLNVVKCDEETADQWEAYKAAFLTQLTVEALKDDINLNWLRNKLHL